MKRYGIISLMSLLSIVIMQAQAISWADFGWAMELSSYAHVLDAKDHEIRLGMSGRQLWQYFENAYTYITSSACARYKRIPKVIHQIWIGKKFPQELEEFRQTILSNHPDWGYKLWTQKDIPLLSLRNRDLIEQARNPGQISDLLRYEILYQFGGVYLDGDIECLRNLDELHELFDFYIGLQPLDSGLMQLGIGIMGARAGHPLLHACIEDIRAHYDWARTHAPDLGVPDLTGPVFFTRMFVQYAGKHGLRDIALPALYFYPLGSTSTHYEYERWLNEGAFTVHHWAKSWLIPSFRRERFKTIKN